MSKEKNLYFKFDIVSNSFMERAEERLKLFGKNHPEALFYAALELRMGIESRLFEYADATFASDGDLPKKVQKSRAIKLYKKLLEADPEAAREATMGFVISFANESSMGTWLKYTPITEKLINYHGKLGEILHFNFFKKNKYWYFNKRINKEHPKSLLDYEYLLVEILHELKNASEGTLLRPPNSIL